MKKQYLMLTVLLIVAMLLPACAPAAPDCTVKEVFCVGLVTGVGKIDDKSINQSTWEGLQRAEAELNARIEYIETSDANEYAANIATFGDQGYDVIVTVGPALSESTTAAVALYPETDFIGVDQFQSETVDGLAGLNFREDNAGFLVGALAAMMSESNKVGAVCAPNAVPAVWRFAEGYKAGAAYIDQFIGTNTEVLVIYQEDAQDPLTDFQWGETAAKSILEQGVDTIFGCGGLTGNGAVTAAAQAGAYAIGADTDQFLNLPEAAPYLLSSAMKFTAPGVFDLIKLSAEGQFPSGNYFGDAGYAPFHDLESKVPAQVRTMMEQIHAGLLDGSLKTNIPAPE